MANPRRVAVILAGAVSQGGFEAGALSVIAETGLQVVRIVATSSGALNAVHYAAAVRARRERVAVQELLELWRSRAGWTSVFHTSVGDLVRRRGLSDSTQLRTLLRREVAPSQIADPAPINLRLVVAPLDGVTGAIGAVPATTYEQMLEFDGSAFDDATRLEAVFTAALASAAFPLVFAPIDVPGLGPCVDGGAVNNNPVRYALDGALGASVDAVLVVSPTVALAPPRGDLRGVGIVSQLATMLVNERLYRDLQDTDRINRTLEALAALAPSVLDASQLAAVKRALGWEATRIVDVIPIRPLAPLPGNTFSGFFERENREASLQSGIARARAVLSPTA